MQGMVCLRLSMMSRQPHVESKIAIMERELDRNDATLQDILEYKQRLSAIESVLDINLSEVYMSWIETVDDAAATKITGDLQRILNDFND